MNWLRIIDYVLLLILLVGTAAVTYISGFSWSRAGAIVIPLIVIILLIIEDRRK